MKTIFVFWFVVWVIVAFAFAGALQQAYAFDYYQTMLEKTVSEEVVLLDIGEKSLELGGQWPWPRSQIAQLVSDLRSSNAGIIGLTVMHFNDFLLAFQIHFNEIFKLSFLL